MGKTSSGNCQNPRSIVTKFCHCCEPSRAGFDHSFLLSQVTQELDEELSTFLQMAAVEKMNQGMLLLRYVPQAAFPTAYFQLDAATLRVHPQPHPPLHPLAVSCCPPEAVMITITGEPT